MSEAAAHFQKYSAIIEFEVLSHLVGVLRDFEPIVESASTVQIECGMIYCDVMLKKLREPRIELLDPLIDLVRTRNPANIYIIDATGHHRPVYRALLVYCWLKAFQLEYETLPRAQFGRWEEALRAWCDLLESDLGLIAWPAGAFSAKRGSSATEAAWTALALHIAGKVFIRDAWTDLAADTFGRLVKRQLEDGALLDHESSDSIETWGYHELVTLHACASYAVQAEDRVVARLVARATEFHAGATQPDHSSTQPWAVFAFIWNAGTCAFADQLLHAATSNPSGVSLMLLADALYCLKLFETGTHDEK